MTVKNRIINSTRNDYYESNTNCLITRIIDSRQFRWQSIDDNALAPRRSSWPAAISVTRFLGHFVRSRNLKLLTFSLNKHDAR